MKFLATVKSFRLSRVLSLTLKKSFETRNQQVVIQNFGENKTILDTVLPTNSKNSQLSFLYKNVKANESFYAVDESGILIFDTLKSLSEFNRKTSFVNNGPKEWQFFVYIDKAKAGEIATVISETKVFRHLDWSQSDDRTEIIHFQYFLVEEEFFSFCTRLIGTRKRSVMNNSSWP
jgi:hypothetical protein